MIEQGLPDGTTIEMIGTLKDFICCAPNCQLCSMPIPPGQCETPGGSLGGHGNCFEATLDLVVTGTGQLEGFNRYLLVPVFCEVHTGPRNPGDPVQSFPTDMFRLQGELFGDPDFCTLRIAGGTKFELSSPGHTTLTELPSGDFAVDSFFDITYQIEFEGCPDSVLGDLRGTTTATIRMETGFTDCEPIPDGSACREVQCSDTGDECKPIQVNFDPITGRTTILECNCLAPDKCFVDLSQIDTSGVCVVPDNGSGTATMPPMGCEYTSPDETFLIIDGLPPGTTIEMDGILMDFICCDPLCQFCSMPLSPGQCETPGGTLGGHGNCFEATLDLTVSGTGTLAGFIRHLAVPVFCEVHTGPRNPGAPVQSFQTDMFRLRGELFGDPDFCTFRISGGTDFGMPSSGQTTLTQLPSGDFAVDSFFDITYQIGFEGCPGSILEDYAGTTTATIRMQTRYDTHLNCTGDCPVCNFCEKSVITNPDGTTDVDCKCTPDADLDKDGDVDLNDFYYFADQFMDTRL